MKIGMEYGLFLAILGVYAAWMPAETHASTPMILSLALAVALPVIWRRSGRDSMLQGLSLLAPLGLLLFVQTLRSPDRCLAIQEVFLVLAMCTLFWIASLEPPSDGTLLFFALGLAALAIWGLYQVGGGLEKLRPAIEQLPEASRPAALARIQRARAFASLLLPSHLAVLLATALPILLEKVQRNRRGLLALFGVFLTLAGIAATRSPVGALLAAAAGVWVLVDRQPRKSATQRRRILGILLFVLVCLGLILLTLRPDVLQLKPLKIRADNWSSALWIFSQAPFSGAGLGSFGHAVRSLPFPVDNYPLHAHCLPLELMADLGIGGLLLWSLAILTLIRLSRKLHPSNPGLAIAILIIPIHNLVDFSIFSTGLALPWVILLAWAVARCPRTHQDISPPPIRWRAGAFAATGLALVLSLAHLSSSMLEEEASGAGSDGFKMLRRAAVLAPWRSTPSERGAVLALDQGDPSLLPEARDILDDFRWQEPNSAVRAQLEAHIETGLGRPIYAAMLLRRAAGQYFRDQRRAQEYRNFIDRLESINDEPR